MKLIGFFLIVYLIFLFDIALFCEEEYYVNPVGDFIKYGDVSDPCVLKYEDKYYLYATSWASHTWGFKVWESEDLVNWVDRGKAFSRYDEGNGWGQKDFWAPEVVFYEGYFYMVYSARAVDGKLRIALAKSSSPLGPFKNIKAPLLDEDIVCIDGHIFIDDDGSTYLFYVKDCSENIVGGRHVSQIYVQGLNLRYCVVYGEPVLAATPTQPWELQSGDYIWNEGPYVVKHNGIYYLMYSGNAFFMTEYAIGYATATNPLGPYTKYENNPVLKADLEIGVSGPGHHCVTTSPDGTELFIVYHSHIDPNDPSKGRTINIDRMYFDEKGVIHIKGPTRSPQPMPSGVSSFIKGDEELEMQDVRDIKINRIFPNPFNDVLRINYEIVKNSFIKVRIYDSVGKIVKTIQVGNLSPGKYCVNWNGFSDGGNKVSSGVYFCEVCSDSYKDIKKFVYLK